VLSAAVPALGFFNERIRIMVDFNALDKIYQKYRCKKRGYDFDREISNELKASLLERILEELEKKKSLHKNKE
jgi:hypothetical protein